MTVFRGRDAIKSVLEEIDAWLSESVAVYLLGGSAMTVHEIQAQTEDIDLALSVASEFEHVYKSLRAVGFVVTDEPTDSIEDVGKTVELQHDGLGYQVDLFERQVVGKVWITDRMQDRADEFWSGSQITASTLSEEDIFLLKAVSGGDVASGRRRDVEDMRRYAQRGLDFEVIVAEIDAQRPFNTGSIEAQQIRDRSHPLCAIERSVNSLSGLPTAFTSRIETFATGFQVEYTVLGAVEEGINNIERIRERVRSNVRALTESQNAAVDEAITRLVTKQILEREGNTVRPR